MLERVAEDARARKPTKVVQLRKVGPNTILIREWGGTRHEVTVVEKGVVFRGKHYRSLSQVACVITGSQWSGPLFFGLRAPAKEAGAGAKASTECFNVSGKSNAQEFSDFRVGYYSPALEKCVYEGIPPLFAELRSAHGIESQVINLRLLPSPLNNAILVPDESHEKEIYDRDFLPRWRVINARTGMKIGKFCGATRAAIASPARSRCSPASVSNGILCSAVASGRTTQITGSGFSKRC